MAKRFPYPELYFDSCLDQSKIKWLITTLPATYDVLNELAPWRKGKWPIRIRCMSNAKIIEGRKRGAGHGYTYTQGRNSNSIWLNPHLTAPGYWLVFTHENLHHAYPDATEQELNCTALPYVFREVFGKSLDSEFARENGVGSPVPGVGDRSFCR